jgi:hypothetical protein
VYPISQNAQISALSEVQAAPVAPIPFEQVQVLALHEAALRVKPVLQLAQIAALLEVQLAPVAASPFVQLQMLALQTSELR